MNMYVLRLGIILCFENSLNVGKERIIGTKGTISVVKC